LRIQDKEWPRFANRISLPFSSIPADYPKEIAD
jgi:hypothetical protein